MSECYDCDKQLDKFLYPTIAQWSIQTFAFSFDCECVYSLFDCISIRTVRTLAIYFLYSLVSVSAFPKRSIWFTPLTVFQSHFVHIIHIWPYFTWQLPWTNGSARAVQPTAIRANAIRFFFCSNFILFFTVIVIAEFVIQFIEFLKYFTIECNLSTKYVHVHRCCRCSFVLFCFYFDLAIDIWFTELHLRYIGTAHSHSLARSNIFVVLCDANSFSLHSINT